MITRIFVALAATTIVSVGATSPIMADTAPQTASTAINRSAESIADSETELRHAYDKAGWQPIWSNDSRAALRQALSGRARNGLDHVTFLSPDADKGPPANVDVAYTRAALAYADALAHGRVDPKSLHDVYTVPRPDADLGPALTMAVKQGKLGAWLDSLAPQDAEYQALSQAYLAMRQKPADAAQPITLSESIHVGDTDPRVATIAAQLVDDGYLGAVPTDAASGKYTQPIADAVKAMQRDYGIADDGIIGPDTLGVLNARPGDRARALAVALERRRWLSRTPPATRIDVNTAAATLRYYRDGKLIDERKVIVGEPDRETPSLRAPIFRLVANPTWTVPKSIQTTELAHVGPAYLRAHNMKMENGWIVQQPGPDNALGLVKFDMKDDQAIYLHDTSNHALFDRSQRHLSHGCVRVSDALGFAKMIAEQEGVADKWAAASASGKYTIVDLPQEIPVRLLYHNVFVGDGGRVSYRTDPYGWNDAVATKLGFGTASNKRAKAGEIDVGP